ncbi:MAG: hypothetical protein K2P81_11910 [Bacteriovoracaceae bacterium]|nr:hypothetical protein [Bacteriovoracaceae bacterium]
MEWTPTTQFKIHDYLELQKDLPSGLMPFGGLSVVTYDQATLWTHTSGLKAYSYFVPGFYRLTFSDNPTQDVARDLINHFNKNTIIIDSFIDLKSFPFQYTSTQIREYGIIDIPKLLAKPPSRVRRWWNENTHEVKFTIENVSKNDFERHSIELKKFSSLKELDFVPDFVFSQLLKHPEALENVRFVKIEINGVTTKGLISLWGDTVNIDFNWSMIFDKQSINHTSLLYKALIEWGHRNNYKKLGVGIVKWMMNSSPKEGYQGVEEFKKSWNPELHKHYIYTL